MDGKYSTGYATHSLFPCRGKFHPQLIRALLNILRVKPGHVVLDPMAGRSTVAVEANLLGIDSISVDLSPFCELMGKVKTFALSLDVKTLESIAEKPKQLLEKLKRKRFQNILATTKTEIKKYYEVILLAFLDSMGFANRAKSDIEKLFPRVLERYVLTIKHFQNAKKKMRLKIGKSKIIQGSALNLPVNDDSVDAIITSPPYSFAVDYLKNDRPQLQYLGYKLENLREDMIGLRGSGVEDKLKFYFDKMKRALGEMKRVAREKAPIVIILGTNDIQTNGVNLQRNIIELAKDQKLNFNFEISKPIRGLQNTMKSESVLFFKNGK